MPKFEGCVQAKEISLCPIELGGGANPHAHVLMLKSMRGPTASTQPEKTSMTDAEKAAAAAEAQKANLANLNKILLMNDVTKAHYLGLDADAQLVFIGKSLEDMTAEAEAAKSAADKAKAEEEAKKSGVTVEVLDLQKTVASQAQIIKELQAGQAQTQLEKRAATEFAGFPGGVAAAVAKLKDLAALPEETRKSFEDMMKAQCTAATTVMRTFGAMSEADVSKVAGAEARLNEAAKKYAEANKCTLSVALEKVSEMREYAADVEALQAA